MSIEKRLDWRSGLLIKDLAPSSVRLKKHHYDLYWLFLFIYGSYRKKKIGPILLPSPSLSLTTSYVEYLSSSYHSEQL